MSLLNLQASTLLWFLTFLPPHQLGAFMSPSTLFLGYLKAPTVGERAGVPRLILINHVSPSIRCPQSKTAAITAAWSKIPRLLQVWELFYPGIARTIERCFLSGGGHLLRVGSHVRPFTAYVFTPLHLELVRERDAALVHFPSK